MKNIICNAVIKLVMRGTYDIGDDLDKVDKRHIKINTAIIKLAKYYGVSTDYLLGITENIEDRCFNLADLKLDDETVEILRSKKFNNRLLCEIIKHPNFQKFMSDTEIYVDSLASMQIKNLNSFVVQQLMNTYFLEAFKMRGWEEEPLATPDANEDALRSDFRKSFHKDAEYGPITLQIEVEFGNVASSYRNYFKFQLSYSYDFHSL